MLRADEHRIGTSDDRFMSPRDHYSPKEFSERSGLSLATIHRYLRSGKLPFVQLGGRRHRLLIPWDALQLLLTPSAVETPAKQKVHKPMDSSQPLSGPQPRWLRDPPR